MTKKLMALAILIGFSSLLAQSRKDRAFMEYGILGYDAESSDANLRMDRIRRPAWLKEIKLPVARLGVNVSRDSYVTAPGGTRITFQRNSFRTKDGRIVRGRVDVLIKEVIQPIDYVVAGIGLSYKSSLLESAGMFNVQFKQNGQNVKLTRPARVQFPNFREGERFDVFKMEAGQWQRRGPSQEKTVAQLRKEEARNNVRNLDKPTWGKQSPPAAQRSETWDNRDGWTTGVRITTIDGAGWWNFDYPKKIVACVKGTFAKAPAGKKGYTMMSLGLSVKGLNSRYQKPENTFSLNVYRNVYAVVIVFAEDDWVATARPFQSPDKEGWDRKPEGPKNFKKDIGQLKFRKLTAAAKKNPKQLAAFLGLPNDSYGVKYETPPKKK